MMVMPLNVLRMVIFLLSVGWAAFLTWFAYFLIGLYRIEKEGFISSVFVASEHLCKLPFLGWASTAFAGAPLSLLRFCSQKMRTCAGPR